MQPPHVGLDAALLREDPAADGARGLAAVQRPVVPVRGGREEGLTADVTLLTRKPVLI